MAASGFEPYQQEWWHYVLRDEPYPDTYFDFPILYVAAMRFVPAREGERSPASVASLSA